MEKNLYKGTNIIKRCLQLLNISIFIWSFWCEKKIFYTEMITSKKRFVMYILIKIMLAILLIIENKALTHIINTFETKETKFFIKFFGVLTISLFFNFIYPGVWNYDAIGIVHVVRDYGTEILSQGFLTNLFVGAVLSILPYASAIVFVQYVIGLGIASYIASQIYGITGKKYICMILFVMELLPLSLIDNMLIMRMSLYGHLMILLMYFVWNECYMKKNDEISPKKAISVGILSGIVSTFRFEALFVWIFVALVFFIVKRKCIINKMLLFVCAIISYLIIGNVYEGLQGYSRTNLDISLAMCTSLSLMLQYNLR